MEQDPNIEIDKLTPWDVVVEVFKEKEEVYIMTLKADMPILKKLAEGFSAHGISLMLEVDTANVLNVAKIWGMFPLKTTLDFSPLYVYEDGMTPRELLAEINPVLSIPINETTAKTVIVNIERYYELLDVLKEEERI